MKIIELALDEDSIERDITSLYALENRRELIDFEIVARNEIIVCGVQTALMVFESVSRRLGLQNIHLKFCAKDGDLIRGTIIKATGTIAVVMAGERVALNFLQHLSSISTKTSRYVAQVVGTRCRILDTRKTIPAMRELQKYAVTVGGGYNHRLSLADGVMIKDNHIAVSGCSIAELIARVRSRVGHMVKIEVECDNLSQVQQAIDGGADIVMLDNMGLEQIKNGIDLAHGKAIIEVSGGMTLEKVALVAALGADYISIGELTNDIDLVDIGLDI